VLVRYSVPYSYRGFKALTAERRGAAGILIYSDPADDGFKKGKTYPDGPWGPESHIQRGGVVYDFLVPGDPLTPGWAALPGGRQPSRRVGVRRGRSVQRIGVADGARAVARRAREAGHETEADDRAGELGRGRVHVDLVDRMGRAARARSRRARRRVRERRQLRV